eukprot:CAMPEP_0194210634 /NCGR_PEP_ID=MMETSP0156-20130528/8859_1 /TAXON_ID=33649 /ORGANISM="Thalassionema nitzschioides, Strain L26-B" /LENGTH=293 /DNA_ID=CAMNT_0038938005 /DNA_START=43 /DNA_END=924 /DNA_ORIENTATION=-
MKVFTFILVSSFTTSSAFTVSRTAQHHDIKPLNVATSLDHWEQYDENMLLQQAQSCADSDTCSLEEAQQYLDNIMKMESDCASGALLGSEICKNVDQTVEAVVGLREKISRESQRLRVVNSGSAVLTGAIGTMLLASVIAGVVPVNPDASPFTVQEWWWALRDGYLPTMMQHYFQDGGLAGADGQVVSPFTLQEWWWAAKDGYLNTMVGEYVRDGGLADGVSTATSITHMEWMWAAKDGYLATMMSENFQNGGMTGVLDNDNVLPMTPQEWMWAVKDGYFPTMMAHYLRNGGL